MKEIREGMNPGQIAYALMAEELGTKADPVTLALLGLKGGKNE